ncbi:electron transfer flavoprotein subunit alpha/FixB family protein [Sulfuriferula nivalis]|uniref:Electron transfer flavoprotein subunit alpha n=1 Tax=Sulfuriferula nivalis TaxID=2675298 RepID=A0A809S1U1_9PROT|nr:FAD-binding protein [Sulfuriferula nivalis]BBP00568.1 electron transfer flavoprotein subunit alpha [Sulfuriferula nivalis]
MSILVLAEHDGQKIKISTLQAIGAAKQMGSPVHLLIVGNQIREVVADAQSLENVDKVLVAEASRFNHLLAEDVAPLVAMIATDYQALVAAHTSFARDVLPRTAALLDVAMISDVLEIHSPKTFSRPIYAGNLVAMVQSEESIQVLTIRGNRFSPVNNSDSHIAVIEAIDIPDLPINTIWISEDKQASDRPALSTAKVVVSGGRSLGSKEQFESTLGPLAANLGAAIGATRAAVDSGYASNESQVGQTGTQVAPDLYIALGISGSIQHTAGMKDSKVIVAVNLDPDALIFQVADYGLVADLFDVVPQLNNALAKN